MTASCRTNLFDVDGMSMNMPQEFLQILAEGKNVRIERIVSASHSSPKNFWYDQQQSEWVAVLAGQAEIEFANGNISAMSAGDAILIPAHQRHRVKSTAADRPTIWLAVFFEE
ncbi:MAG TPA: cupin domain-containing protein [Phycisphaerae bacterium]|nr:cupin domain-containing protein [Phycisphaerae bacterium]HPS53555.1 cupin domain-containing protein [Phycisphaerae bacterium]